MGRQVKERDLRYRFTSVRPAGSSPAAPTFLLPWSDDRGIFMPRTSLILKVKRFSDLTD